MWSRQWYCSYHSRGARFHSRIIQILSDKWDENDSKTGTKHFPVFCVCWKVLRLHRAVGLISPHYFHFPSSREIFPRIILAITSPVNNLFPILDSGKIPIYIFNFTAVSRGQVIAKAQGPQGGEEGSWLYFYWFFIRTDRGTACTAGYRVKNNSLLKTVNF